MFDENECYKLHKLSLNNRGYFDKYVDMVYILTLFNSPRTEKAISQLSEHHISNNVIVQYNKGYNCRSKKLPMKKAAYDLSHAVRNIFFHAKHNKYKNILVFEDDYIFDRNFYDIGDIHEIGRFVSNNNFDVYNLGPLYELAVPTFEYHKRVILTSLAHSIIYNRTFFDKYIEIYERDGGIYLCDLVANENRIVKYSYYKPICFQLFPDTENKKDWSSIGNMSSIIDYNFIAGMKEFNLDKSHINFQKCHRNITNMIHLLFFVFVFVIVKIYTKRILV